MSRSSTGPVELHMAFFWICDGCGVDNFVRAEPVVPGALDPEDRELLEIASDPPGQPGEWWTKPDSVVCSQCKAEFRVDDSDGED